MVDAVVEREAKEFNQKVKEVLRRKLASYMAWREETYKELLSRERFTLRYLRQHWAIIRMYMSWIKPYLRNVQKLQAPDKYNRNPELISSFEGALMEIEFLARKPSQKWENGKSSIKKPMPVILATFSYRVKPQLQFQADSYQNRGAIHVGRVEVSLRTYGWTQEDIESYMAYREQETLELLALVDQSVQDAMDALGDELKKYLREAGEAVPEDEKKEEKKEAKVPLGLFEPFVALFSGVKEMAVMPFEELFPAKQEVKKGGRGDMKIASKANGAAFNMYKNYKKAHGMPAW